MTVEEIKDKFSMLDILNRLNIPVKKGFCNCPLHAKDHTASFKVYDKSFYCFGCGAGGDVITFIKLYNNMSFKDACEWISGEELSSKGRIAQEAARLKRKYAAERRVRLKKQLSELQLAKYWGIYQTAEPFSDEWCNAYNEWQKGVYHQEEMIKELGL
jgi:DNA primase